MSHSSHIDSDAEDKTVWILGAGFSAPLGGPMLGQLLSLGLIDRLWSGTDGTFRPDRDAHATIAYRLYHYGRAYKDGWPRDDPGHRGVDLWGDAEAFIDYLDTAAVRPDGAAARFLKITARSLQHPFPHIDKPEDFDGLRFAAKRIVAATCCSFLRQADPKSERWQPFREWFTSLAGNDVVLSFNYDRVLETLRDHYREQAIERLEIVDSRMIERWSSISIAKALKLHGSVDWSREERKDAGTWFQATDDPERALAVGVEHELGIATPGPTKLNLTKEMEPFWKRARTELSSARRVIFVGYRFPPTDASARAEIIGALQRNENEDLDLHVVLGPDDTADVKRLCGLLEFAMRRAGRGPKGYDHKHRYELYRHPLYSQDFLSLYGRGLVRPEDGWV